MNVIGFDFGTTNSTISFYNQETKTRDCFQMNAGSTEYIPTVVAYKGNDISIGDIANIISGRISGAQLFKNLTNTASSVAGGGVGWVAGAAAGAA